MNAVLVNRVPIIALLYWVIKIAATTLGETGADLFSMTLNFGYGLTTLLFLSFFVVLMLLKVTQQHYSPLLYWATFTATAIAGTAISDYIDRTLGLGYAWGALLLVVLLMLVLYAWFISENSINVERITTVFAECFYWLAFLIANTLGTAVGDFMADDLALGFMWSAMSIGAVLAATLFLHFYTRIHWLILFWIAFVLTRPFGATFGDLMTKSVAEGGLGFGTALSSAVFLILLVISLVKEIKNRSSLTSMNR